MKQLKKTLLTLALLLTAATGARADWTGGTYTATATENLGAITVNGDATLTISSDVTVTVTGGINVASGTLTVTGPGTLVVNGAKGNDGTSGWNGSNGGNGGVAISGNIIVQGGATVTATGGKGGNGGNGDLEGGKGGNGGVAFAGTLTYKSGTVTANGGSAGSGGYSDDEEAYASSGSAGKAFANDVDFTQTTGYSVTNGTSTIESVLNQTKVVISGGSEPSATTYSVKMKDNTVDADKWSIASGGKSATGDAADGLKGLSENDAVTLTYTGRLKVKGVKATSDAPAKPAATVTTAPTATTGDIVAGSETALVSGGTATGGTMMYKVTTANTKPTSTEGFSDAVPTAKTLEAGTYYVWYYVKADADHANSEISATAIAVTVKAVEGHALSAAAVGEIVGSDGKAYAAANKDNLPEGVEAVAMIWYVNGTHGLALALADEADDDNIMYNWETANTLCNAHTPAITGATWKLATQDDWNNMITGAGGAAALRDGFSSVVGENLQNSPYWSSTNYKWDGYAMHYKFNDFNWEDNGKENDDFVRACLSW